MRWTEQFFLEVFQKYGGFRLREHGEHAARVSSRFELEFQAGSQFSQCSQCNCGPAMCAAFLSATCADYVYGERKFGGNAQAITSKRWLHHTSLLWDYDPLNMAVLTNPKKQPAYRQVGR